LTDIPESGTDLSANEMVADLLSGHETVAASSKAALEAAEKAGDEVSADIMVQRITVHDKTAWMLRSTLAE
jgi:starvation-inducible DNA-binding protein